jgi:L-aminopeptidase/D-esterase-like protein
VDVWLAVAPQADEVAGEAATWQSSLWEELADLDEVALEEEFDPAPDGAKGIAGLVALLAQLPVSGLAALAQFLQTWTARTGRTVEASIDGDTIKITSASRQQQDRIIEAWIVRHTSST